jgi:phosphoribosylformimino-5-aminoimidazole carboxamide ribotide isomerase
MMLPPFHVIPVLDLRGGQAVWARGGRRHEYQPLRSPVVGGPDPSEIIATIRSRFGLTRFYVADLDAIEGTGSNLDLVADLARHPGVALLVDAGVADLATARRVLEAGATYVIVGSETLEDLEALETMLASLPRSAVVFSLDVRSGRVLSRCEPLQGASPATVAGRVAALGVPTLIALELQRVGTGAGPDLELLHAVRAAAPTVALLAGGGVRGVDDLSALADLGCAGALVGTALASGTLTPAALEAWRTTGA